METEGLREKYIAQQKNLEELIIRTKREIWALEAECGDLWERKEEERRNFKLSGGVKRSSANYVANSQQAFFNKPIRKPGIAKRYCPKCGMLVSGTSYCEICGTKVD